jgi:hypothetical protein
MFESVDAIIPEASLDERSLGRAALNRQQLQAEMKKAWKFDQPIAISISSSLKNLKNSTP